MDNTAAMGGDLEAYLKRCFDVDPVKRGKSGPKEPKLRLAPACLRCGWKTKSKSLEARLFHIMTAHKDLLK